MAVALIVLVGVLVLLAAASLTAVAVSRRPPPTPVGPPPAPPAPPSTAGRPTTEAPTAEVPPASPVEVDRSVVEEAEAVLAEAERARAAQAEPVPEPAPAPVAPPRPRFRDRMGKARSLLAGYVGSVLSRSTIDDETWDELEEALVRADVGVATTGALLDDLRTRAKAEGISSPEALIEALKSGLKERLAQGDGELRFEPGRPNVWLFVGVNGVGKTTTIGKVGRQQLEAGRSVVMAAADTFRAAAAEQLELWSRRVGAPLVRGDEGGDPAAVVFDAVERAAARGADLVLADTAGRLHTKVNLMEELKKVRRVADREPGRVTEVLLVIDATTGQNGLVQAREFTSAVDVTGVVLTKLDGTAKGGIALAIRTELGIPIKLVGLGETVEDLVPFDAEEFVEALFA